MAHAARLTRQNDGSPQGGLWSESNRSTGSHAMAGRRREVKIASAILDVARAEAGCLGGARLVRIGVTIGADCDIDLAALDYALKVVRHGTDLERVGVHIMSSSRRSLCHRCGWEFASAYSDQPCPQCNSLDSELIAGDELELAFIEVERP